MGHLHYLDLPVTSDQCLLLQRHKTALQTSMALLHVSRCCRNSPTAGHTYTNAENRDHASWNLYTFKKLFQLATLQSSVWHRCAMAHTEIMQGCWVCSSVGERTPSIKLAQGTMVPSGRANPHCVIQYPIQYCLQNHKAAHSVAGHSSHAFPVGSRLVRELWPQADKLVGPKPHLPGWLVSEAGHVLPFCYTDKEGRGVDKHRVTGFDWKERVFPNMHTVLTTAGLTCTF